MNEREYLANAQNLCVIMGGNFSLFMEEMHGYMYALIRITRPHIKY